jgi:hypothetical protein
MEEKKPNEKASSGKRNIGGTNTRAAKSKSYLAKITERKKREERLLEQKGKQVTFELIKPTRSGAYTSPNDIVFIPDNWEDYPYLHGLVEKRNGTDEYLTGIQKIRYVRGIQSIFVENQPEEVQVSSLLLLQKNTLNDKRDANLVKFLRLSNKNFNSPIRDAQKQSVWREVVFEDVVKADLDKEALRFEAEQIVFNEKIEKLYPLANIYGISLDSPIGMKSALRKKAIASPKEFLALWNSEDLPMIEQIVIGRELGVWKREGRKLQWRDGSLIGYIPVDGDEVEAFLQEIKNPNASEDHFVVLEKAIDATMSV